ncbi:hypothetical protein, partial [Chromobacterium haemolyticum]
MGALMDSASPAGWQWRRESGEQDLPMAELLSRQLEREPGSLPLAARLLGLAALSEAQVGEAAARFDLLPLAE